MRSTSLKGPARNLRILIPEWTEMTLFFQGAFLSESWERALRCPGRGWVLSMCWLSSPLTGVHWDPLSLAECFWRASLSVAQRRVTVSPRFSGFSVSPRRFSVYGRSCLGILSGDGGAFLKVEMPVKRSLKLDGMLKANSFGSPKITRKKSAADYSPTTGTCQMSPIASPTSSKEQENRNGPSNG